ncbi:hypothetical protein LG52_86 [Geobacillus kaustophilus]|uniref:Uncharacterized protein n=1 Tax=Geobacillus kaustophilus TaxID=1462 RepID=A0A0D8BNI2_GEOKU|nr:hypothetical protein [Geobacillus kaustophilus]KJE25681.1 hypothetical protein LG52_86 [Geobacillus kaustophilus]
MKEFKEMMKNIEMIQMRLSLMKLNLLEQQLITKEILSDIKRLEKYLESKEDK